MILKLLRWILSIVSERGGAGSASRVSVLLIVSSACFVLIFLVIRNHSMPELAGLTAFVTGGCGALYGINRFSGGSKGGEGE
jgi:hypothetical protein